MSWEEIDGQDKAISFLKNILVKEKLSGAYLFVGPPGVGKNLTARNFAKILNCEQRGQDLNCCDACPSCIKVDSFNHPDVSWIEAPKDALRISISQIRNIKREIALKPYEGKRKIYIILNAELLSEEASNCLLKTLEEPPPAALLILTTSDIKKLLPTIISRCQIVKFSHLSPNRVEDILKSHHNQPPLVAAFLANFCEGKLGQAIELKERDILNEKNEIIDQLISSGSGFKETKNREEMGEMCKILLSWYRDILVSKYNPQSLINLDRRDMIVDLADRISFERINEAIKTITRTNSFIQRNINPNLALEVMQQELKDV